MSACRSPEHLSGYIEKNGSRASWNIRHCENGFLYMNVEFVPKNVGRRVRMQGKITVGSQGEKPITRQITFCDDGKVYRYGTLADGVRFRMKDFDIRKPHRVTASIYFEA